MVSNKGSGEGEAYLDEYPDWGDPRLDAGDPKLEMGDPKLEMGDPKLDVGEKRSGIGEVTLVGTRIDNCEVELVRLQVFGGEVIVEDASKLLFAGGILLVKDANDFLFLEPNRLFGV